MDAGSTPGTLGRGRTPPAHKAELEEPKLYRVGLTDSQPMVSLPVAGIAGMNSPRFSRRQALVGAR